MPVRRVLNLYLHDFSVFIFVAFSIFYVFHGLLREKKYELYVLILAILVVMVYCIVEYIVNVDGRSTLKLVN